MMYYFVPPLAGQTDLYHYNFYQYFVPAEQGNQGISVTPVLLSRIKVK